MAALAVAATAWRAARLRDLGWCAHLRVVRGVADAASCSGRGTRSCQHLRPATASAADVGFLAAIPLAFAGLPASSGSDGAAAPATAGPTG